jgi:hypothetical protein
MGGPVEKICVDCGESLPDTEDHFKRKKTGALDSRCLRCRRQALLGKRKKDRAAALQDIERGAVSEFTKAAGRGGQTIPHSCEVLERLMEYFGGTSGFTALLVKQYFDSPPGGSARTKILESILRLVTKNTEAGGAKKPLGQWTDAELESELDTRLQVLAVQIQGRIIDGTIAQEAEGPAPAAIGIEDRRVRSLPAKRAAGRAGRKKDRGPKALSADPEAGGDACLHGE